MEILLLQLRFPFMYLSFMGASHGEYNIISFLYEQPVEPAKNLPVFDDSESIKTTAANICNFYFFFLACKVQIIKQFHEKVFKRLQLKSQ